MSLVDLPPEICDALRRFGLLSANERAAAQPLTGGVSSDIWRVDLPGGTVCVKQLQSGQLPPRATFPWGR